MHARYLKTACRRYCRRSRLLQIAIILGFWLAGDLVVRETGLPIPGAIMGLFIVLLLLGSRRLSVGTVRRGARWFLAEMLLFFIPAVLAVLDHPELLGLLGLKVLAVIVPGTFMVMMVTVAVIDICYRLGTAGKGVHHGTS